MIHSVFPCLRKMTSLEHPLVFGNCVLLLLSGLSKDRGNNAVLQGISGVASRKYASCQFLFRLLSII